MWFLVITGIEDQQVGCLWQGAHLLSVALSGNISYLNFNNDPDTERSILRTIKGHNKSITALEGNGDLMFSGSHDGLIIYWNMASGEMDQVQNGKCKGHTNQVQALRYNRITNEMVSIGLDDCCKFISLDEFKYTHDVKLDSQPRGVDVSKTDGKYADCFIEIRNDPNGFTVIQIGLKWSTMMK